MCCPRWEAQGRLKSEDTKNLGQGGVFLLSKPCDTASRKRFTLPSNFVADFVVLRIFGTRRKKIGRLVLASLSRPLTHTLSCVFSPR